MNHESLIDIAEDGQHIMYQITTLTSIVMMAEISPAALQVN